MRECSNCHAKLPEGQGGTGPNGDLICCPHCIFNPEGCRCQYGEFGVAETYRDCDYDPTLGYGTIEDEVEPIYGQSYEPPTEEELERDSELGPGDDH